MIFLSALLRKHIYDIEGHKVGVLRDVCVSLYETFPTVTALVITTSTLPGNNDIVVPWSQVDNIEEPKIYLNVKQERLASYEPHADELLLKRDLLDKQIVDTQGFRVVKVNDLKLAQIKGTARLIGVDISEVVYCGAWGYSRHSNSRVGQCPFSFLSESLHGIM